MSLSDFTILSVVALHFLEMIRSEVQLKASLNWVPKTVHGCWMGCCARTAAFRR
jgi:hypothetical protein